MQTPRTDAEQTDVLEPPSPPPADAAPSRLAPGDKAPRASRAPSIIVGVIVAAIAGLSIWFLVRPQPLLVQGEVDATRLDIAARIDGRVADIPVTRGENVAAGAVLVRIDNPRKNPQRAQGGGGEGG